ncbi:required for meiotic nuclear division protein 1 homolog isoform X2 [Oratosquilla oratoria]|uniref:required for meiotic nuclear division protein 1 homolog isoform X2 n=1 Tax=Oratosquilla oratoria TaxID=337810 RepID=UPI003F769E29
MVQFTKRMMQNIIYYSRRIVIYAHKYRATSYAGYRFDVSSISRRFSALSQASCRKYPGSICSHASSFRQCSNESDNNWAANKRKWTKVLPSAKAGIRLAIRGKDSSATQTGQSLTIPLQSKKRIQRKKKQVKQELEENEILQDFEPPARHKFLTFDPDLSLPEISPHKPPPREWYATAYATADVYDLEGLLEGFTKQGLYSKMDIHEDNSKGRAGHSTLDSRKVDAPDDVLHMVATYRIYEVQREIFFFRDGSVVFWNVPEIERQNVLAFIKTYEHNSYISDDIEEESESLPFAFSNTAHKTKLVNGHIMFSLEGITDLEKYTFSNALALSVGLGMREAAMDRYIDSIEYVSEELKKTGRVVLNQHQVLQRMGQLFELRHQINLSLDLLDTPDFYWEREDLETLFQKTCNHLCIAKRTSVMNLKLSHCVEVMEVLKSHLSEQHGAKLEWIIIILIMVEVGFEILHFII